MSKTIKARPRKTSRQAAKTKTETVYCPEKDGAFKIEQITHHEDAGDVADCTRWPDGAEIIAARASDYSGHVDAYWNARFEREAASKPFGVEQRKYHPPSEGEYDSLELRDLQQALKLLTGYQDRSRVRPTKRYLEPSKEFEGRKAIARLLRSEKPVDRTILQRLAALFDPDPETEPFIELSPIDRRLEFVARNAEGGRPVTTEINRLELAIAFKTAWRVKGRAKKAREDALSDIADEYACSTRTVEDAWSFYNSVIGRRR